MLGKRHLRIQRILSGLLVGLLVFGVLMSVPPHSAAAKTNRTTVFLSNFNGYPLGPLPAGTAVPATVGSILPETDPVAIIDSATGSGRALAVQNGTGKATLQFRDAPAGLPADPDPSEDNNYSLVLVGDFTASVTETAGASVVLVNGGAEFELFNFGADGQLTRGGVALGLTYGISSVVKLQTVVDFSTQTMFLRLLSGGRSVTIRGIPAALTPASLTGVRLTALGGLGTYTADNVNAEVLNETEDEPAAIIVITPPSFEIIYENGVAFIIVLFDLNNSGGHAKNVFLTIDLDDFLELSDLNFLEGLGYVVEVKNGKVTIGLGYNNEIDASGKLKLKIKFKVKKNGDVELKVKLKFKLKYSDSEGEHEGDDINVEPVVPVVVVAPIVFVRLPIDQIDVRFKGRWDRGGGLRIYGFPLTQPIALSNGVVVQYFERVRFEYHPEFAGTEYEILLGLMGVELGFLQPPVAPPTSTAPISQTWYFPQTGHYIDLKFRAFWENRGGLYTFGYPIGEAFTDGKGRWVQYFERTRLEWHVENEGTEYEVLLGLLGEELLNKKNGKVGD